MQKKNCKYYIQIDKTNIEKILKNETPINFNEINKHTGHDETTEKIAETTSKKNVRTEKETNELAINLIKGNITEELDFHIKNFRSNKIFWNTSKIRKLLYILREQKFPKEEEFLNSINSIKIKLSNTEEKEEIFCIGKGTFVNFRKKKD